MNCIFRTSSKLAVLFTVIFFCFISLGKAQVSVSASQGTTVGSYSSVNNAFAAINAGTHKGNIVITVTGTTLETGTPTPLLKSANPSNYSSILIKPSGDAIIYGDTSIPAARAVLELVGSDNITINGDDPNVPGKKNLTITIEQTGKPLTAAISLGSNSFGSDGGDSNIVIKNCNIIGGRTSVTSNAYTYGISFTNNMLVPTITWSGFTTSFAHSHRNITIDSNNIKKAYYGIYAAGNDTFPSKNIAITNNFIGSDVPEDAIGCMGVFVSNTCAVEGSGSAIIEGNDITVGDGLTGGISNLHVMGIMVYEGNHGIQIRKNNIHDILHIQSSSGAWGIAIQGTKNTSINIVNNFIRDVAAGQNIANAGNAHFGNHGIYAFNELMSLTLINNTVVLNRSNAGGGNIANSLSSCLYFATSVAKTMTVVNNIFVNNQPSTNSHCFLIGDTANFKTALINGNNFYSSTGNIGFLKNTTYNNLAQWQTATNKDAASVNTNPAFALPTDLHITGGMPTALESGGLPVSVTNIINDFDGDARPGPIGSVYGGAKMPDIGADEFDGNMLDQVGPVIMYTALGKTCDNLDRVLTNVMISDATGINLTGSLVPRIYFSKNNNSWVSNAGIFVSGNKYQSYWSFTISSSAMGGIVANDTINYFVVAQDLVSTANLSSLPIGVIAPNVNNISLPATTPFSYLVGKSLNGTYTVGTGGNYSSISEAVNAYHASCLTGNVVFSLISNDYSTENYPIVINGHNDASATHTLTIKPAAGNTVNINYGTTSIFNLNGADYVTIDGSNNGTNTKDFTITNNLAPGTTILFTSLGTGKGATHNTIKNLNINGGDYSTRYAIGVDLSGADNDYNTVSNCSINDAYVGISALNTSATDMMDSVKIINNNIGGTHAISIGFHGIETSSVNAITISGNTIRNVYTDAFRFVTGIDIGPRSTNGTITQNNISGIKNDYSGSWGSFGISFTSSNAVSGFLVANNFISDIVTTTPSQSSANSNAHGIRLLVGTNIKIYHNSINMAGTPAGTSVGFSSCILILTGSTSGLEIKNNILSNTEAFTVTGSKNYCIYASVPGVTFSAIDYNDYYGLTNSLSNFIIGYNGGADRASLTDWAGFTNGDVHSISVSPDFNSISDLHLLNGNTISALESAAPIIVAVNNDYDGDARPGPTGSINGGALSGFADIGADEFDRRPILCHTPFGVTVSNVMINTATINFIAPTPAPTNGYEYIITTNNGVPNTSGTAIGTTQINANTLQDGTLYYVYVRSVCGTGNYSDWSSAASFNTNCLAYNTPYFENFDGVTSPNLPSCMKIEDISSSGSTWFTRLPWIFGETGQQIQYTGNASTAANNWFYLPGLNLTGGQQYVLGFKYLMTSSFATEKLKVAYGTNNYAVNMTNVIFDSANIKNKNFYYRPQSFFTPAITGIYYIGFNVYSAANQSAIYIDSITVNNVALPVKLSSFTGFKEGNNNILNWTTLTEANNKGFAVERSNDGTNFSTMAFIDSKANGGNSAAAINYIYTDTKPFEGVNYYRLKQTDFNGKTDYSNIVKLTAIKQGAFTMYPNPAKSVVNISVDKLTGNGKLIVIDYLGKVVKEQSLKAGTNTIDIANLTKGMYFLSVITHDEKTTMKLIVE